MAVQAFVAELNNRKDYQRVIDPAYTCGMKAGRVWLEPGTDCGVHSTEDREEALIFLSGRGTARIKGKDFAVGEGRVCYIPPHTEHNIINTGSEPLVYIFCVAPVLEKKKGE
ncbi:MAG TPA: cupin domain-containing protein [Anaerohalosphaeraceae bacterium]|nr:cupin domain-containing protein [Anaerohalosphaeraceae bacterium]